MTARKIVPISGDVIDEPPGLFTSSAELRRTSAGRALMANPDAAERYRTRNRGASHKSKYDTRHFIAWDGEGVTVKGRHRYVLLAHSEGGHIVNPKGLEAEACFDLMLRTAREYPKAIHVIFGGSYDANMMLKGFLKRPHCRILASRGTVNVKGPTGRRWRITYHPRHTFTVSETLWDAAKGNNVKLGTMTLWDVIGSFQSSFVAACKQRLSAEDLDELAYVQQMKNERGSFTLSDIPEMLKYCRTELGLLVKLQHTDADDAEAAGIYPMQRWDGAGAKASVLMAGAKLDNYRAPTPDEIRLPARYGYAGGRIELPRFGDYVGPAFTVDRRSAYPFAQTLLPCLKHGRWHNVKRYNPDADFALWHVAYHAETANDLHPFFWRAPDGRITYPPVTEGWYWNPEVSAALKHVPHRITITNGWVWRQSCDHRPFDFVAKGFRNRKLLDRQRSGRGQPLKLALNAGYGKMAQQIGAGKDGKPPKWHQLEWAGWTTSHTRAWAYDTAYPLRHRLIGIATDGLTFTGQMPANLAPGIGPGLGDLEHSKQDAGLWVQSGIYWLRESGEWKDPKVRGIAKADPKTGLPVLRPEPFRKAIASGRFWQTVTVPVERFRGLVTSSISRERFKDWGEWITEDREIACAPAGKRIHLADDCAVCRGDDPGTLHYTLPTGGGSPSSPHVLRFDKDSGRMVGDITDEWWLANLTDDDESE